MSPVSPAVATPLMSLTTVRRVAWGRAARRAAGRSRACVTSLGTAVALAVMLLMPAAHGVGAQATTRRYAANDIVQMLRSGVKELRVVDLLADGCVVGGAETATQQTLRGGGASAKVQRLASSLACPAAPSPAPTSEPRTSRPPTSTGAGAAAARFGLGADQFVLVQPGSFEMGSSIGGDESPVHRVTLTRAFYLQKTEVTQAQWQAVMGNNPSRFTACGATCPVEQVSWSDVQQFIARLNRETREVSFRLPTEAEWEYAARAGTTGDFGGTSPLDQMGWYDQNAGSTTRPVGQKQANALGLYDMHGNVWEWVQDWASGSSYAEGPAQDPQGAASGYSRVLRGGSWASPAYSARASVRSSGYTAYRSGGLGFRLARTP